MIRFVFNKGGLMFPILESCRPTFQVNAVRTRASSPVQPGLLEFAYSFQRTTNFVSNSSPKLIYGPFGLTSRLTFLSSNSKDSEKGKAPDQKTRENIIKHSKRLGWILLFALLAILALFKDEFKKLYKFSSLQWTYGRKKLELPDYFVQGTTTDQEMKKNLDDFSYKVTYLAGTPGKGKSTSVKHIINELRKEGRKVYYFPLKQTQQQGDQAIVLKRLSELEGLFQYLQFKLNWFSWFFCNNYTLIIDDINALDGQNSKANLEGTKIKDFYEAISGLIKRDTRNVILISSQPVYESVLQEKPHVGRVFGIRVVQPKSQDQLEKAMTSILFSSYGVKYEKEQLGKEIADFKQGLQPQGEDAAKRAILMRVMLKAAEDKCSLRFVKKLACPIKQDQDEQQNQEKILTPVEMIEEEFERKKEKLITNTKKKIRSVIQQYPAIQGQSRRFILKSLINMNKEEIKHSDCDPIVDKFEEKNLTNQAERLLLGLDKANVLVYCHPRSNFERMALQRYLESPKK